MHTAGPAFIFHALELTSKRGQVTSVSFHCRQVCAVWDGHVCNGLRHADGAASRLRRGPQERRDVAVRTVQSAVGTTRQVHAVVTRVQVAPKYKTHPNFNLDFLVWGKKEKKSHTHA